MNKNKMLMIAEAIETGDWTNTGDLVSRNDLMEYLIHLSETEKRIQCPICTQYIKPYKITFTHRSAKYLLSAIFLSDMSIADGGDGYVHHDLIKLHTEQNWKYERGKKKGAGIVYTSYSNLTQYPYDFLEPMVKTFDKVKRNGEFKPTEKCRQFLRGKLDIPEWILRMNGKVVKYSLKKKNILTLKDVNFHQCIELFKTFS